MGTTQKRKWGNIKRIICTERYWTIKICSWNWPFHTWLVFVSNLTVSEAMPVSAGCNIEPTKPNFTGLAIEGTTNHHLAMFFSVYIIYKKTIETTGKSQLPPKDCWFQLPNQPMRKQFACILPLQKKNLSRLSSIETPPTRAMFGPKPKIQSQDFDQKIKV